MPTLEPDLFLQFAIQRLFDRLALAYATLRKLPATAAGSLAEEYLAIAAHQQDADIGAKTLGVDPVAHVECFTGWHAAEQGRRIYQRMRRAFAAADPALCAAYCTRR